MTSSIYVIVHSNGSINQCSNEGITFSSPSAKLVRINRGITLERLQRVIHRKLHRQDSERVASIHFRYPIRLGPGVSNYTCVELTDDEDVEALFNVHDSNQLQSDIMDQMIAYIYNGKMYEGAEGMQESSTFSLENLSIERSPLITRDKDEDDEADEDYHVSLSYESIDESNEDEIDDCEPSDNEVEPDGIVNSPMVEPISIYPSTEGGSQFWGNLPHYTNINWNHPDEEDIPRMDLRNTWSIGQDLYVGLEFENKDAVKNAVKQNAMRMHQSFYVVESKKTKWVVRCPNAHDGCGWYMRAIESKKSDKWKVTQWGGRHTCLNMSLSQDHAKLDSELIATFIQGMVNQDPSIKISLI
ncbi:uncharacterized protein LOC109806214 [Cajanus cajan]|uniref:uncharacterized protein LOC109806214 n=1 Tax=Cajanus cajan TaxID=3821 RepID=UPI00098D7712|nr:uncharacterized protein LOC109806214 [Cajanus cajan]